MNFLSLADFLGFAPPRARHPPPAKRRPQLEVLEDRSLLAPMNTMVSASPNPIHVNETTTLSGSFFDPQPGPHTVHIDWGSAAEGSTDLTLPNAVFQFSAPHQYHTSQPSNAPFHVSATVKGMAQNSNTGFTDITVLANPPPATPDIENDIAVFLVNPTPTQVQLGQRVTFRFGFLDPVGEPGDTQASDPSPEFRVVIRWGDGTHSTVRGILDLGRGLHLVNAHHTYTQPGRHRITITVTESDNMQDLGVAHFHVVAVRVCPDDERDIGLRISATTFPAHVGAPIEFAFGWVDPLNEPCDLGEAPDPAPEFKAVIDWGDGTQTKATDLRNLGRGLHTAHAMHAYNRPGMFQITFEVIDSSGSKAKDSFLEPRVDVQP
jgi:hypothetical protein